MKKMIRPIAGGYKQCMFGIALYLVLSCGATASAADINFEATVDRATVSLGSNIQLSLTFFGTQNMSAPELPEIDGFKSRYLGPSTRMSIVNGKVSSSITHIYTLLPVKTGSFTIPSLSVNVKGNTYTSKPISVQVVQGRVSAPQQQQAAASQDATQSLADRVFVTMQAGKRTAYVNEVIPLTIKLYVNKLTIRDIQYPQFDHEGFSVDKFKKPKQYQEVVGGIAYDVIEFSTDIFALHGGECTLGPAVVQCNVVVRKESKRHGFPSFFGDDFFGSDIFDDFFGRYETYPLNLESTSVAMSIMDMPLEGKPHDFSGAIGKYHFDLRARPREVKVGDPVTLTMVIAGEGNLKAVQAPILNFGDDFKIYEPDITQDLDSKTIEQVVIPKNKNVTEIPPVTFSFFDTQSGTYKTVTRGPLPIAVKPLPKGEELKIFEAHAAATPSLRREEAFGHDIIYIKDYAGALRPKGHYVCMKQWFILLLLLPLLSIIFIALYQKKRDRLQTDIRYARRLRAPRTARKNLQQIKHLLHTKQTNQFYDAVFKTLQEYLGDKFHLPTAGITADVVTTLASYNIDRQILDKLKVCFDSCDTARYAPSNITRDQMYKTVTLLEEIIDQLEG